MLAMKRKDIQNISLLEDVLKVKESLNLTDRQKEIFDYYYIRGWYQQDIAEELSMTLRSVQREICRIQAKLAWV